MKPRRRHSHIFEKEENGFYTEPQWLSTRLLEVESFGAPGALVLDPAAGWMRIPRAAVAAGYAAAACDIVDRRDLADRGSDNITFRILNFLTDIPACKPWSVITNPPFDHIKDLAERAIEIAKYKTAVLCPLRRLPAAHWLERLPLETVYLLSPRPSVPPSRVLAALLAAGKKPSGGRDDFAWLVFNTMTTPIAPRLRWLHRDRGAP